jgi:hypothetical protein
MYEMNHEKVPTGDQSQEILQAQESINEHLSELYNEVVASPVNLPHRAALRTMLSAAAELVSNQSTERVRIQMLREKLQSVERELREPI